MFTHIHEPFSGIQLLDFGYIKRACTVVFTSRKLVFHVSRSYQSFIMHQKWDAIRAARIEQKSLSCESKSMFNMHSLDRVPNILKIYKNIHVGNL